MTARSSRPPPKPGRHVRHPRAARFDAPLALERFVPFRIAALAEALAASAARLYAMRFALSTHEWRVLVALGDVPLSPAELGRRTGIERGRVARLATALARRGLVVREADPFDARRTALRLTQKGRALYRRLVPVARAREQALLEAFSPAERRELERLLEKLEAAAAAAPKRRDSEPEE